MSMLRKTFSDHFRLKCLWGFLQNSSRTDTNGRLPNSSQKVRGKGCSGHRVRALRKKSRTLWPQLPQWTFVKFKPKGTRKMLFGPKGTCIAQKLTYPLASTATVDVFQIQAKGYEENVVRAKGYAHYAKSHVPFGPNCRDGPFSASRQSSQSKRNWRQSSLYEPLAPIIRGSL